MEIRNSHKIILAADGEDAAGDLIPAIYDIQKRSVCISPDLSDDQAGETKQELESQSAADHNTSGKGGRLALKSIGKALTRAFTAGKALSWFFWVMEVYVWMIVLRILISWFIPGALSSDLSDLYLRVTDPGLNFFEKQVPPLVLSGIFHYDLPVLMVLIFFLISKFAYRAFK
jgi:uncharacterized protein YggT (Ycf19 family)